MSYSEALQQRRQPQQQQQQQQFQAPPTTNQESMASVSDAAAEIYSYSYNKQVDAPPPPATAAPPANDPQASGGETTAPEGLSKDLVAKVKASKDDAKEEASQGGSRFQELMDRAREKQPGFEVPEPRPPQMQMPSNQGVMAANGADPSITPPSSIMTPDEVSNLSIEEQARLFREYFYVQQQRQMRGAATAMMQQQQQQQNHQHPKSIGSTPDNYLEAGIGFDGRKIGRNRDAEIVSNASDVYFAQLKKDSTTRNIARYSGDNSKANAVFHDPSIQEISAPVNPYLEDQQKRMRDVIETVPEEMLVFQDYNDPSDVASEEELRSKSGISYKEKMEQKKREREERRRQQQQNNNNNGNGNGNGYTPY